MLAADAGSQPRPPEPTLALGVQNLLVRHFPDHAVTAFKARRALCKLTGRLISMALAIVEARARLASSLLK